MSKSIIEMYVKNVKDPQLKELFEILFQEIIDLQAEVKKLKEKKK